MPIMIDLASPSAVPSPDWVANAFPAAVRGDQNYLGLCLDTLESLIFQDSVLPGFRPSVTAKRVLSSWRGFSTTAS